MSDSIFGNPAQESQESSTQEAPEQSVQQDAKPAESTSPADSYDTLLAKIQAEDGRQKYADIPTALESIPHAQNRIKELTDKIREMEEKLKDSSGVDEVLKRLESQQASQELPSQELDETKLAQMLDQQLTAREKARVQETNQKEVVKSLTEAFGDKAEEMYIAKAKEYGVDVSVLNDLAKRSPKAVYAYFGLDQKKASPSGFGQSSVNTAAMGLAPKATRDPMDLFKSSESDLVKKWRESTSKIEG